MTIDLVPLALPPLADVSKLVDFGREVKGINPGGFTPEEFKELKEALYKVFDFSAFTRVWLKLAYPV